MYKKTDKRRIYELMEIYLSNEIDAWTFCDEFYYCYDLELDSDILTELEAEVFSELAIVSGRFSKFEEDLKKYPGTYFTEEQLKLKILDSKCKLKEQKLL